MKRNLRRFCFAVVVVALAGCSTKPDAKQSKQTPRDKLQGKAEVGLATNSADAALNAGGPSVYLLDGVHRYSLFFSKAARVEDGKQYIVEGIYAQKAIDEIGDPDGGKNGYPLPSSCERVVRSAWPGMAFDITDAQVSALRARVKRYPGRPVFLVTRIQLAEGDALKTKKVADAEDKDVPEVAVEAEKQRALLVEGPAAQPAPLWSPEGGTVRCKLIIDEQGKVSKLETGVQLCEAVPWEQFRYKPRVERGRPVSVKTEVEVRFDPRK
jgi:hypothetical protein